ncbi:hypothetical protein ACW6QP_11120 [Salegentibacter sp. HM20]
MDKKSLHPFLLSLHALERKMEELIRLQKVHPFSQTEYLLLDNADFIQLFKITPKTAKHWRESGLIEYIPIKGKIYYKISDVKTFIDRYRQQRRQP